MFNHSFDQDLDLLINKIINKESFAFARYADGELAVLNNKHITGCDGWTVTDQDKLFSEELASSLLHAEENYYYGISCPCCDPPAYNQLKTLLIANWDRVTFSNLFVNSNWKKSYDFFMSHQNKIFICNSNCKLQFDYYKVPPNVISAYRTHREDLKNYYSTIAKNYKNMLFCISAGPLAELIIHWMYGENPENQYVDVGSCLDPFIHGRATRIYHHQANSFNNKVCVL
jgi:hypothetical protein